MGLGETKHQSCVLLTSREKPTEVAALEGDGLPVRTLALSGLEVAAGQTILTLKGLSGTEDETRQLVECYGGNPLALKIAATSIRDLYAGNIGCFFAEGTSVFKGIGNLLDQQFSNPKRTSPPTPLRSKEGSSAPPTLVGKGIVSFHFKQDLSRWLARKL